MDKARTHYFDIPLVWKELIPMSQAWFTSSITTFPSILLQLNSDLLLRYFLTNHQILWVHGVNPPCKNWLRHWNNSTTISSFMSSGQDFGKHRSKRGTLPVNKYYREGHEGQHFLWVKYCPGQGTTGCLEQTFYHSAFILSRLTRDEQSFCRPSSSIILKNTWACSCNALMKLAPVP